MRFLKDSHLKKFALIRYTVKLCYNIPAYNTVSLSLDPRGCFLLNVYLL